MPAVSDPKTLGNMALFRGMTAAQLSWLNDRLHGKTFPAETNVMAVEQPGEVLYIIFSGAVKVHLEQLDGNDVILAILGPGEIVGEMGLLGGATGRSANVLTLGEATLVWMDRQTLQQCLRELPAFTDNLLRVLCDRIRHANDRTQWLSTLNVPGRVAAQILSLARQYGQASSNGDILIPLRLTQSDIASLVGASRERVNQAINGFKRSNVISVSGDYTITIHNPQALAQRCQFAVAW